MIHFHEASAATKSPEQKQSEVTGVHPKELSSAFEAHGYWDTLFSHREMLEDEQLFSEMQGWYEEDFAFDFEIDESLEKVLEKFEGNHWAELSEIKKEKAIRELAEKIGEGLGLDNPPMIAYYDAPAGDYGGYNQNTNTVEINRLYLDSPGDIVDTVAHEMRHAYQHQRAQMGETHMDQLYAFNIAPENYIVPGRQPDGTYASFTEYQGQLVEAEAGAFAKLFVVKEDIK